MVFIVNHLSGVMVSTVDHGLDPQLGQTKDMVFVASLLYFLAESVTIVG
jgi:hypothetical protein